jgi:hypothetical protein
MGTYVLVHGAWHTGKELSGGYEEVFAVPELYQSRRVNNTIST